MCGLVLRFEKHNTRITIAFPPPFFPPIKRENNLITNKQTNKEAKHTNTPSFKSKMKLSLGISPWLVLTIAVTTVVVDVSASSTGYIRSSPPVPNSDSEEHILNMISSIVDKKVSALETRIQTLELELGNERNERRKLQTTTVTPPVIPDVDCSFTKVVVGSTRYCTLDAPFKVNGKVIVEDDATFKDDVKLKKNVYMDGPPTNLDSDEDQDYSRFEIGGHVRITIDSDEKLRVKSETRFEDDVDIYRPYDSDDDDDSSDDDKKKKKNRQPDLTLGGDLELERGDITLEKGDVTLERGDLKVEKGEGYFAKEIIAKDGIEVTSGGIELTSGGDITFKSSDTVISATSITIDSTGTLDVGDSSLSTSTLTVGGTAVTVP